MSQVHFEWFRTDRNEIFNIPQSRIHFKIIQFFLLPSENIGFRLLWIPLWEYKLRSFNANEFKSVSDEMK